MANFTETSPIRYKDYVAQNPVDSMTAVGMQREQQLAQGIQKVRDSVSKLDGLDIANETQKQYLQASLKSLTEGVTKNLSGDFSDSRIVNQITGAAAQIYKDPIVQNAIISTGQVRKGQAEMEEARKKGENGVANDAYFNETVQSYIQDANPNSAFRYNYEKYSDVNKHAFEIVAKLHPSGTLTDEAFTTDKKGNRVLSDAVIRNGFKGVRPEQIKAALRAGLSPQDWRQLELDGMYQYSNMPDEAFPDMVQKSYSEVADRCKAVLTKLNNASTNSPYEKDILEQKKASIAAELDNLKNEYDGVTSTFASGDVKSGKAKLHTLRSINNLASSLSYGETQSTYTGDTPQQMEKWRQERAQNLEKWQLEFNQRKEFHDEDKAQKAEELRLKKKEVEGYGSLGTTLSQDETPALTFEKFTEVTKQIGVEVQGAKNTLISANKFDPNSKEGKEWYAAKEQAYKTSPASLDPITLNHFKQIEQKQREYDSNIALGNEIVAKEEADPSYKKPKDFVSPNAPALLYSDPTGRYQFNPTDFINASTNFSNFAKTVDNRPAGQSVEDAIAKAKAGLSSNQAKLAEMQYRIGAGLAKPTEAQKQVLDHLTDYSLNVIKPYGLEVKRMSDKVNAELNKRITINQGSTTAIPAGSAAQKASLNGVLAQFSDYANQYSQGKIGNTDAESLAKLQKDNDKSFTVITTPGSRFQEPVNKLIVTGSDGSKHEIPMTEQQKQDVFGGQFSQSPTDQAFSHIDAQIRKAGGFSTQLGPKPYLGNSDFRSVKNYGVQANVEQDPSGGGYILKLSINDPVSGRFLTNIPYPSTSVTTKEGIVKVLNNLDDAAIFEMINQKAPSAQDLDALQKSAQKPTF